MRMTIAYPVGYSRPCYRNPRPRTAVTGTLSGPLATPSREAALLQDTGVVAIAHVIELAVAPVFLLSAIGAMLSVMTNRLARVVDRARVLEREALRRDTPPDEALVSELATLSRRATLNNRAITLCTLTALLICAVIAVLFLGAFLQWDTSRPVGLLFLTAMVAFFLGLVMFLREIFLATTTVQIGLHHLPFPTTPTSGGIPPSQGPRPPSDA
jgi:hypothetical protein